MFAVSLFAFPFLSLLFLSGFLGWKLFHLFLYLLFLVFFLILFMLFLDDFLIFSLLSLDNFLNLILHDLLVVQIGLFDYLILITPVVSRADV